jgi:hypothetical protein
MCRIASGTALQRQVQAAGSDATAGRGGAARARRQGPAAGVPPPRNQREIGDMKSTKCDLRAAVIAAGCAMAFGVGAAGAETVQARLKGVNEVPSVSTGASARFRATIDAAAGSINWELEYAGLQADATQAHIHFAQRHTTGPITVWLCGSATNPGPAGTQPCPARAGTISGTITAANVLASPATQQLPAGGFAQLVDAMRAGATYANVHTTVSPGGEIRGQIRGRGKGHDHDDDHHGH